MFWTAPDEWLRERGTRVAGGAIARRRELESMTHASRAAACSMRRKLDYAERRKRQRDAPRLHGVAHFDHPAVACDEEHVDGESHEEGVDAVRRRNHQPGAGLEAFASQQSLFARLGVERRLEARDEQASGRDVQNRPALVRCGDDWRKEVVHEERPRCLPVIQSLCAQTVI
jgi:hypothetical protein